MKSFRFNRAIFSAGAIVLGIVLLIWPASSLLIIAKCVGIILAVGGIAACVMYYRDHESAIRSFLLVLALVMLICGGVIFMHPEELVKLIPTIVGILVMFSGLINLGETFILSRSKYGKWWISLIIAIITIGLGVFIINKAFSLAALITRIAGGVLIFDGASHLWVLSRIYKASKEAGSTVDGTAVEVGPKKPENGAAGAQPAANSGAAGAQPAANNGAAGVQPAPNSGAAGAQPAPNSGAAGTQSAVNSEAAEAQPAVNSGATETEEQPAVNSTEQTSEAADAPHLMNSKEAAASDYPASDGGNFLPDEEDDTPGYMKQIEQETDFLQYSMQNPVKIDDPGPGDGESGQ